MGMHSKDYAEVKKNNQNEAKEEIEMKETIGSKIGKFIDNGLAKGKRIATSKPAKILGGLALGAGAVAVGMAIAKNGKDNGDNTYTLSDNEYSEIPVSNEEATGTDNISDNTVAEEAE